MPETKSAPGSGRHQRRMRNYLLDRHFQLKYASYLVLIAVVLSAALGIILWRTSRELLRQNEELVARGQAVVEEGKKVSDVVKMNIIEDPDYGDDPALKAAFEEGDKKYTGKLQAEQEQLRDQAEKLAGQHRVAAIVLIVTLLAFVVFVGLAGIVVTHKVAGPIFKMKRQIRDVADGHLAIPQKLRKGDELVDFFDAFESMVRTLRNRQQAEIELLEGAITKLEVAGTDADLGGLRSLLAEMKAALD